MDGLSGANYRSSMRFLPIHPQNEVDVRRLQDNGRGIEFQPFDFHGDIDAKKTNGVGPGMAFANSILAKHPGFGVVGLVPCAIGGTNIREWERGKVLYNQMMRRAKASLSNGGTIRALLWYQGEADTVTPQDAQAYKRRLHKFFLDVCYDLQSPLLPIIQVFLLSVVLTRHYLRII